MLVLLCSCAEVLDGERPVEGNASVEAAGSGAVAQTPDEDEGGIRSTERRVEELPSVVRLLTKYDSYDEVEKIAGGSPGMFSYGDWKGVSFEPNSDMAGGVESITVMFWASDVESLTEKGEGGLYGAKGLSFFVIENEGRLEKRANRNNAKTMELRANGTEFALEADLGSVETVKAGAFSYPSITDEQVTVIEKACFEAGAGYEMIQNFDRDDALELLAEIGVSGDGLEELSSGSSGEPLRDALNEAYAGIESMSDAQAIPPTGLVSSPVSFSNGYRWTGRLAAGERMLAVELKAGTSINMSLQSAAGPDYQLVPDQLRFSPQGQCVTVTVGWEA